MPTVQTMQMFCLTDPDYYDALGRLADEATRYPLSQNVVWPGWQRSQWGLWSVLRPGDATLPEQGWKIHLSAVPEQGAATLDAVATVCLSRRVPFKFLRSRDALAIANGKYMSRGSSGKFAVVYPADERQLSELLDELVTALDGSPGPYILSDLRIGRGPVHVRYGSFVEQWCTGPNGDQVPALRDPAGILVPDSRAPVFHIPPWVEPPSVLRPHLAARAAATAGDFPYRVVRALYFTNAGGTYLAEHRETGQQAVLREARPYSGLDGLGADACSRLRREYDTLVKLDELECVPRAYGTWAVWEHEFVAEEYIAGQTLLSAIITSYPLLFIDPPAEALAEYLRWTEKIVDGLSRALDALHARGISFGDLHPSNVIVRPDDSVVLIDFEYAGDASASGSPRIGAPGYTAPVEATGAEADWYSLRATWLMMLMPLVELAEHDPGKTATFEALARQIFSLSPHAGPPMPQVAGSSLARRRSGEAAVSGLFAEPGRNWPTIREALTAGILRAGTPERADRLFPADPEGFDGAGALLAYGAAGVLLALHRTGTPVPAEYADWLAAAHQPSAVSAHDGGPLGSGLFDGLHGVAVVLDELGRRDDALELLSRCRAADPAPGPDLYGGQAGVALSLCHFARVTGDSRLLEEAIETAFQLDTLVRDGRSDSFALPSGAGLLHGLSGGALLQVRLYEITGDKRLLRAARRALSHELRHCVAMRDDTVQVKSGHRHLLYLDGGSGGIALVAWEYLRHREDPELAAFIKAVRRGCGHRVVREPGLFQGRAGLLAVLARLTTSRRQPRWEPGEEVLEQSGRLAWHAVHRDGALLIPGRLLRRFSADLATGSAGVLLALHCVFDSDGDLLSLLLPRA